MAPVSKYCRPGGRPVIVKTGSGASLVSTNCTARAAGAPAASTCVPGFTTVTAPAVGPVNAVVPLGVPSPVGPS
jgi:hypothetical protein